MHSVEKKIVMSKTPPTHYIIELAQNSTPGIHKAKSKATPLKGKPATREPTTLLKLEVTTWESALSEHELLPTKRTTLEWVPLLLFVVIGVITAIEPFLEFRVRQNFVCLINRRHLFLRILGRHVIRARLVRVVKLREFAVSLFDFAFVCIAGYAEHLVVVFRFGAFE